MTWVYDWEQVGQYGFFQGYNSVIWTVVLLQVHLLSTVDSPLGFYAKICIGLWRARCLAGCQIC
jgi:hypothetical protein